MADPRSSAAPGDSPGLGQGSDELWAILHERRHDLEALLRTLARHVVSLLGDGCVITTLGSDGTSLVPRAVAHRDPEVEQAMRAVLASAPMHLGEGIVGSAAADRRTVALSGLEPATVAETTPRQYLPFVRDHPMRAIAVVPLLASGELVGTLGVVRTSGDQAYSIHDVRLLEGLAERAAYAIDEAVAGPRAIGTADFEAIYRHHPDGVALTTPDGHILAANPAACSLLGLTEREIIDRGRAGVVDTDDPRLAPFLAERAVAGRSRTELRLVRSDGTRFTADVTSAIFTTPEHGVRAVVIFRNVSEEVTARELAQAKLAELERSAGRDELTDLWNRQSFAVAADQALAVADRQGAISQVVFIDVDDLKHINDTYGHRAGDAAIVAVSSAISRSLRHADLACRFGGDEFVLLLSDVSDQDLGCLVERIEAHLAAPGGGTEVAPEMQPTISVGSAERPPGSSTTLDELIHLADGAMYHQKLLRRLRGD